MLQCYKVSIVKSVFVLATDSSAVACENNVSYFLVSLAPKAEQAHLCVIYWSLLSQ